ncbi:MAG: HAD family hydrolase [Deltaproteobacteria bacterium]|nr:HAD family hydrolase [Deltaproteobacteria bacterium]
MPIIKAVIYDFDGVIVDSREANRVYYNRILAHFGLPPLIPDQMETVQTRTSREVIAQLLAAPHLVQAAQELEKRLSNDDIIPLIRLEPYVRETLSALKKRYRTAIATNRGKSLPLVLQHHSLAGYFELIVSSAQVQHPKPHPEYLERILQAFSLTPAQAVYIGDAELDAQLAAAAGVPFLAYKNPDLQAWAHLADHRDIWRVLDF